MAKAKNTKRRIMFDKMLQLCLNTNNSNIHYTNIYHSWR